MNLPLEGIRVLDLTVVWSGPGATTVLGDLGAEVIRLEGTHRTSRQVSAKMTKEIAAASGYHAAGYPDQDPGERPYERSALFNWHARNKLSVCVNLETPEGRRTALELVAISDVLLENNGQGTVEKLGLGTEALLAVNPRLVVARMPSMGLSGPMADYLGYGPNFNSLVGIAVMDGYEGDTPDSAGENYHMDEAGPAGMAFAVMAALWDRDRTGVGGIVEFAQAENVMQDIGEFFLGYQMDQQLPPVLGNSEPRMLQDVYLSADEDRWVAVTIRHDDDWAALQAVVNEPWLEDGRTAQQRRDNSADLRAKLGEWARGYAAADIVQSLQAVRIPAGEVMSETRLLNDPHLAERKWFHERTHPSPGTRRYPGHPWRPDGFDVVFGRPLPGFGEDNHYVYKTLLHYPDDVYDDLVDRGIITDRQEA